jgi:diguanylate cyclase (GGDEF)-like protein
MTVMACMRDVTRRKLLEDRLTHLALLDELTGLDNRRAFDRNIDLEWRRTLRTGIPLSLIFLDVDNFKSFNDTYGHLAGDECLLRVAVAIRNQVHRAGDSIARYGGEEFASILPSTGLAGAETIAKRFRSAVEGLRIPHRNNIEGNGVVTISCGVAAALLARCSSNNPPIIFAPDDLIAAADHSLYSAKSGGRNRVVSTLLHCDGAEHAQNLLQPEESARNR